MARISFAHAVLIRVMLMRIWGRVGWMRLMDKTSITMQILFEEEIFIRGMRQNRQKGLPIDEARQSFRSHYARLANLDKARLDDDEKEIIDARQEMFALAKSLYIAEQEIALGIAT